MITIGPKSLMVHSLRILAWCGLTAALTTAHTASAADASGIEFFESKVRPLLVAHCYECHSANAKELGGNLLLDAKAGWQRGGDNGPAVVP